MLLLVSARYVMVALCFVFQAEDGIRDLVRSRGLGDVYKRQGRCCWASFVSPTYELPNLRATSYGLGGLERPWIVLSLIHI